MKRISILAKKVRADYREFQALHQPMAEPWKKEEETVRLKEYSISGLKEYFGRRTENYKDAVEVWKLQLRNPDAAIRKLKGESVEGKKQGSDGLLSKGLAEINNPENMEKLQKSATDVASAAVDRFKTNTREAKRLVEDNKEDAKEFVYDRLKIMSDALRSFNAGYQEGKSTGQADAMSKSPEELYTDIVQPLQQKLSKHVEDVVKKHDVDADSGTAGAGRSEPVTPAELLLRHAKEALEKREAPTSAAAPLVKSASESTKAEAPRVPPLL
jgi:hypothetical protein